MKQPIWKQVHVSVSPTHLCSCRLWLGCLLELFFLVIIISGPGGLVAEGSLLFRCCHLFQRTTFRICLQTNGEYLFIGALHVLGQYVCRHYFLLMDNPYLWTICFPILFLDTPCVWKPFFSKTLFLDTMFLVNWYFRSLFSDHLFLDIFKIVKIMMYYNLLLPMVSDKLILPFQKSFCLSINHPNNFQIADLSIAWNKCKNKCDLWMKGWITNKPSSVKTGLDACA